MVYPEASGTGVKNQVPASIEAPHVFPRDCSIENPRGMLVPIKVKGKPVRTFGSEWSVEAIQWLNEAICVIALKSRAGAHAAWFIDDLGNYVGGALRNVMDEARAFSSAHQHRQTFEAFVSMDAVFVCLPDHAARPLRRNHGVLKAGATDSVGCVIEDGSGRYKLEWRPAGARGVLLVFNAAMLIVQERPLDDLLTIAHRQTLISIAHEFTRSVQGGNDALLSVGSALSYTSAALRLHKDGRDRRAQAKTLCGSSEIEAAAFALEQSAFDAVMFARGNPKVAKASGRQFSIHEAFLRAERRLNVLAGPGARPGDFSQLTKAREFFSAFPAMRRHVLQYLGRQQLAVMLHEEFGTRYRDVAKGRMDEASDATLQRAIKIDALGGQPFILIGDSHSTSWHDLQTSAVAEWHLDYWIFCAGASASGLSNPASRLQYGNRILSFIKRLNALDGGQSVPILLKFGQVDLEFVFHHRRIRSGSLVFDRTEFDAFKREVVARYVGFLTAHLTAADLARVTVMNVNPPVLSNAD